MPSKKYSKEILEVAIREVDSISDLLVSLGVKPTGGSHGYISKLVKMYALDTSHFTYSKNTKSISTSKRKAADEILILNTDPLGSRVRASKLTRALIEVGVPYSCNECGLSEWQGKEITLDVDHIDGNYLDSRKENLRFLCPNCHRQTPTFARSKKSLTEENRNKKICGCGKPKQARSATCSVCYAKKGGSRNFGKLLQSSNSSETKKLNRCIDCDREIHSGSIRCSEHYHLSRKGKMVSDDKTKIIWPPDEIIISKLQVSNYTALAKELGVSGNAIRKRLRIRGYDVKTLKQN